MVRRGGHVHIDGSTVMTDAAPALLSARAEKLFVLAAEGDPAQDPELVHDLRVASRRLREALGVLGPLYPRKEGRTWYRRFREVTRALGPVRDADVAMESLVQLGGDLTDAAAQRVVWFAIGYVSGLRERDVGSLRQALRDAHLKRREGEFARFVQSPIIRSDAGVPLARFAQRTISTRAHSLPELSAGLCLDDFEVQHSVRIAYKRLRYALEIVEPAYRPTEFRERHAALTEVQDVLGHLHDAHVLDALIANLPQREVLSTGATEQGIREVRGAIAARAKDHETQCAQLTHRTAAELEMWLVEPLRNDTSK